jgi:sigma-B regulation protein RsbU (phosphoserine phosphatase)
MANLQATLRGQSFGECSPKECLNRSNALLYSSTSADKFVTLFYGLLDIKNHKLTYSNAGHDNPFLLTSNNSAKRLKTGGIVLGIMDKFPFEEEVVELQTGDLIAIYSDGIAEAMNGKDDMFGEERIFELLQYNRAESSEKIIDLIIESVKNFAGTTPQFDDITLVIIKKNS